jgi:hypothetical protein
VGGEAFGREPVTAEAADIVVARENDQWQAVRGQQLPGEIGLGGVVGIVGGEVAGVHDEVRRVGGQPGEDRPHVGHGVGPRR